MLQGLLVAGDGAVPVGIGLVVQAVGQLMERARPYRRVLLGVVKLQGLLVAGDGAVPVGIGLLNQNSAD